MENSFIGAIPRTQGALVTEKGNKEEFVSTPVFVVLLLMLFLVSSSVTKTRWWVYLGSSQRALIFPNSYSICERKALRSGRENVCQECGSVRGVGAGLMQVYRAHAALFGN